VHLLQCPKPTHFNYNSDQLLKIFRLVGTPTDKTLLSRMQCLHHFATWPAYSRKLEEMVFSTCTAERLGQGDENAAQQLAQEWIDCLSCMLHIDPTQRQSANGVLNADFWNSRHFVASIAMPVLPGPSSAGSNSSGRSQGSQHSSAMQADKPKLALRNKRQSAPLPSKVPLQPLQTNQRRMSHMIPLEGRTKDRGDKDVGLMVRRVGILESTGPALPVQNTSSKKPFLSARRSSMLGGSPRIKTTASAVAAFFRGTGVAAQQAWKVEGRSVASNRVLDVVG